MGDPALFQQAPDFYTGNANDVWFAYLDGLYLTRPRIALFGLYTARLAVTSPIGVINRITDLFFLLVDPVTPLADAWRVGLCRGDLLGAAPGRMVFVEVNGIAGCVNDLNTHGPGPVYDPVDSGSQLGSTLCCAVTVVGIPHVADNQGRALGIPGLLFTGDHVLATAGCCFCALAEIKREVTRRR